MYDRNAIDRIREKLSGAKQTVAIAESVTAGHIQAAISSAEKASDFLQGGITVYNLGQKTRHLDVEPIHAESVNSVSEIVATQMATGINKKFLSDYGIGITGYASTVPELDVNEIFAWVCIAFKNEVLLVKQISSDKSDPVEVQIDYTNQVLSLFENEINRR